MYDLGACCNLFNDDGDSSSDGDDDDSQRRRRRKRMGKGPTDRRGVKKVTVMEAVEKAGEQMKATRDAMVQKMRKDTERPARDLLDEVNKVSMEVDDLEDKTKQLESDLDHSKIRLVRRRSSWR